MKKGPPQAVRQSKGAVRDASGLQRTGCCYGGFESHPWTNLQRKSKGAEGEWGARGRAREQAAG